jgi:hypothetical protein
VVASGDLNPPNLGAFWARIEQGQSNQLCSDWQIQHIELSQTWVVRFPCAVSSRIFKNPDYIDVKRLTSASATAQMGAPVALRLTMLTTLKHPMQLSDISRGICSLILGAMGHCQTAEKSLLLHVSAAWSLAVI